MLEAAFVAGLAAEGVEVIRLGVAPTPAVAFEAARLGAMGAVVSASHNPYEDNGIKLFAVGGTKLPDEVEAAIERELGALARADRRTRRRSTAGAIRRRVRRSPDRGARGARPARPADRRRRRQRRRLARRRRRVRAHRCPGRA